MNQIIVTFKFPSSLFDKIPPQCRDRRIRIPIIGLLFTQGINEMQTISNTMGDNSLQEDINSENLELVNEYYNRVVKYHTSSEWKVANGIMVNDTEAEDTGLLDAFDLIRKRRDGVEIPRHHKISNLTSLMNNLREATETAKAKEKNFNILKYSSELVRELGGGRITCCKSGKDRTGMKHTSLLHMCMNIDYKIVFSISFPLRNVCHSGRRAHPTKQVFGCTPQRRHEPNVCETSSYSSNLWRPSCQCAQEHGEECLCLQSVTTEHAPR